MFVIDYHIKLPTSVYHACEAYGKIYVGGSLWNRRKALYTKEIAKNSNGVLRILRRDINPESPQEFYFIEEIIFPCMVYTITEVPNRHLFVACKSAEKAFTLIDERGIILNQRDDGLGMGSYGVIFDRARNELILATRTGKLEFVDPVNLRLKRAIKLTLPETRLWSLAIDSKTGMICAGDYDGNLFVVTNGITDSIRKFDVTELYETDYRLKQGFKPAVWGLEIVDHNQFVIGTRWGDILLLNHDFQTLRRYHFGEDISSIRKFYANVFLVGTRYGKIFSFDLEKFWPIELIVHIQPSLQKENAVWTMTAARDGVLACFADGHVCKIVKSQKEGGESI